MIIIIIVIIIIIKHAVNKWVKQLGLIVIEFLPNLRDFPIPVCRMDLKRDTYHVSKCHWFRQACTYLQCDVNLRYK